MTKSNFVAKALISLVIAFCSTCAIADDARDRIVYTVEDVISQEEIVIRLTNDTKGDLCIPEDNWPDENGWVGQADNMFLEAGGRAFRFREAEYIRDCFDFKDEGICYHHIRPGATLVGRIPYGHFSLPAPLRGQSKILRYQPLYFRSENACRTVAIPDLSNLNDGDDGGAPRELR